MKFKGIRQPSYLNPPVGTGRGSGFRPGRRYPISIPAALTLEEKLKDYLGKGEGIDLSRFTRFVSSGNWVVWTTTGRKVEVEVDHAGAIIEAAISETADPDLPPIAR